MWQFLNFMPVKWLFQAIMFITGWTPLSKSQIERMKSQSRAVYIAPHSSIWDFMVTTMFALAQPEAFSDINVVVKPQAFNIWFGWILRKAGCIPATKRETSGDGFVEHTIQLLSRKERFKLLLAPRGSRTASSWKSGYYWIAKQMNIPIVVVGFDYEYRTPVIGEGHIVRDYDSKWNLERALMNEASRIVPLYPENAIRRCRIYRSTHLVQWYKLFCYLFMITTVIDTCLLFVM